MALIEINKELNWKIFLLFVSAVISGIFINVISDSVRNSIPLIKVWWFFVILIFALIDIIVWRKTGEEIITWILEKLGIESD